MRFVNNCGRKRYIMGKVEVRELFYFNLLNKGLFFTFVIFYTSFLIFYHLISLLFIYLFIYFNYPCLCP